MLIYYRTENRGSRANITQHATHANGRGPLCGCGVGMDDRVEEGERSHVQCRRCLRSLEKQEKERVAK